MKKKLIDFIATFCFSGNLPVFPGTWASFFTLFLGYYFLQGEFFLNYLFLLYFILVIGTWAATEYDKMHKTHDSSRIVIDEVAGQLISLLPLFFGARSSVIYYVIGFVLFRFFDITKILGINKLQKLPKGVGVMADDVLAGVYSAIILGGIQCIFLG
jgi:phosphatidylglycerophosphatase A